jgi:hypothetical protein
MPRPTTKTELIAAASEQWDKLWALIDSLPPGDAESVVFDFGDDPKLKEAHWVRDHNLRDVLIHMYEWQNLLLHWVPANLAGNRQPFLPEPYNWANYGELNLVFWGQHQSTTYAEAAVKLRDSHAQVMALINSLTGEELFTKKNYPWTGTSNVAAYVISATSSHYDWAMKKLKLHLKINGSAKAL